MKRLFFLKNETVKYRDVVFKNGGVYVQVQLQN